MEELRAEKMRSVPSDRGPQADVLLIEPDGQEHQVRCLCLDGGNTEIGVDSSIALFNYLASVYGEDQVLSLCRRETMK